MDGPIRETLIGVARTRVENTDPSHDFAHALRVLTLAAKISAKEGGDLDVIVPAALFHDLVNYPKNDPRAAFSAEESAVSVGVILGEIGAYPQEKVHAVQEAIRCCSFSKNLPSPTLEAAIVQDADLLESTGAIAIMRTFASTGRMSRPFYNADDPFCRSGRAPSPRDFAVDLFFARLLEAEKRLRTEAAKAIARPRTDFLRAFLAQVEIELRGD